MRRWDEEEGGGKKWRRPRMRGGSRVRSRGSEKEKEVKRRKDG